MNSISHQELEGLYQKALQKVGGKGESAICHYLPGPAGGYIHHFTLKKMSKRSPQLVADMLRKHILDPSHPTRIEPKRRAPRGSRKKREFVQLNQSAIERLLVLAKTAGDREAIALLTPKRSFAACRRDLIASVKQGQVSHDLWNAYVAAASHELAEARA